MKIYQDIAGFQTLQSISKANAYNKWMYTTISPFLKGRVLELGSGIGNISDFILKEFTDVTLSDYDQDYCTVLKEKYSSNPNLNEVLSIDLQDPNFTKSNEHRKESFDTIILLNVIEHLSNDQLTIDYCRFLLKKGGNLIVLAPAHQFLFSKFDKKIGHFRRYSSQSLSALICKDFNIRHRQYFNFLGMGGWFFFNTIMRRMSLTENSMSAFNKLVPAAKLLDRIISNKTGISTIVIGERK